MSDFSIKLTVRSSRIITLITSKFGTQSEMSRQTGINKGEINRWVCIKDTPESLDGWKKSAMNFATALGVNPSEIWPDHMKSVVLKKATAELTLDAHQVASLTADQGTTDLKQLVLSSMTDLSDRECGAIRQSAEGDTLDEIGNHMGVSRERARQIVIRAQKKMKKRLMFMGVRRSADVFCDR